MRNIPFFKAVQNFLLLITLALGTGCAVTGEAESPITYGYGINTMPGWQLAESPSSVHAVAGYMRYPFKGGGGKTDFLQLGAQYRYHLSGATEGLWLAGEASYIRIMVKPDGSNGNFNSSAFAFGPVAGYRFRVGAIPVSVYAAPELISRSGSTGFYGRLGFDIHYMSLLHPGKGR